MFKCGLMVMVVTGLIVCPHHNITLVYTTITAHHVITHRALTISTSTLSLMFALSQSRKYLQLLHLDIRRLYIGVVFPLMLKSIVCDHNI